MAEKKNKNKASRKGEDPAKPRKAAPGAVQGRLDVTRSGMAFVKADGFETDIMVKAFDTGTALDGDVVEVEIRKLGKGGGRTEGVVTNVVQRRQTEFSGRIEVKEHFAFFIPDKENVTVDFFVPLPLLNEAKNGDHVLVRLKEWLPKAKSPVGEVIGKLTDQDAGNIAMQSLLMDAGFPLHFPDDVLEEAARFTEHIDDAELSTRRDLRGLLTLTIDPVDAKDFDDALSIRPLSEGLWEVGVHIADVSHFMQEGSALDGEAYRRATSVYLPDRVLPMLPEHLSNGLCSLRPDEDKYAFSAIFQITEAGRVKDFWLGRTVIRSQRRFTYEEVQEIIEGSDGDHKAEILLLNGMARQLRAARFEKGAINFSSQEVRFQLDETGKPIGVVVKESKEAHQLIEEFMLLANRTVAEYVSGITIKDKPVPFPYRVHDVPDEAKLEMFSAFAARFGHKINLGNPEGIARSFNAMLKAVKGQPEQHVLESLGIRTMAKAVYTTENIGHYGLGFDDYCHFTSPIRRYPDVLVHRILDQCLRKDIRPIKNMEQQCRHCSEQERAAMDAERSGNKYKSVEFMQQFVGEEFEAVISGVSGFGFWAETVDHKCEGLVGIQSLRDLDYFDLLEGEYALVGERTGLRLRIGDRVKIRVDAANLEKRQLDYSLVEGGVTGKTGKRRAATSADRGARRQQSAGREERRKQSGKRKDDGRARGKGR